MPIIGFIGFLAIGVLLNILGRNHSVLLYMSREKPRTEIARLVIKAASIAAFVIASGFLVSSLRLIMK